MDNPLKNKELELKYGRCITDTELAAYFRVDVRTIRKYAHALGGMMILPGKYRFFENLLRERIEYAQFNQKKGCAALPRECNYSRKKGSTETETVSGQQHKVVSRSFGVGEKDPSSDARGSSPHGVY
jgi:hypothetical protein